MPDDHWPPRIDGILRGLQASRDVMAVLSRLDLLAADDGDVNRNSAEAAAKVDHLARSELVYALIYTATCAVTTTDDPARLLRNVDRLIEAMTGPTSHDTPGDWRDD